ncbi:MAG: hypothetical protein WAX14_09080 [Rhodococcus sp. (in: high G+C Gram-positive bacteria)]|uniref:hypothetical protein n=1 Tax=Rhodococcus sp. TaxID=1831 RepID=UPI003BB67CE9
MNKCRVVAEEEAQRCAAEEQAMLPLGVRKDRSDSQLPIGMDAHEPEGGVTGADGDDEAVRVDPDRRHRSVRTAHLDRRSVRTVQCPPTFRPADQQGFSPHRSGEDREVVDVAWRLAFVDPIQPVPAGHPAATEVAQIRRAIPIAPGSTYSWTTRSASTLTASVAECSLRGAHAP